jgi:hypothetical protein
MRDDMRLWFTAPDHQVKIVLQTKVEISQRLVILEKHQDAPGQIYTWKARRTARGVSR